MRLHLVLALAVGAAAKDPAHDDQECGEAREEEDRDEEALREILQEMVGWEINRVERKREHTIQKNNDICSSEGVLGDKSIVLIMLERFRETLVSMCGDG